MYTDDAQPSDQHLFVCERKALQGPLSGAYRDMPMSGIFNVEGGVIHTGRKTYIHATTLYDIFLQCHTHYIFCI